MEKKDIIKGLLIGSILILTALSRVFPHPWNFTPVVAILIFSAANIKNLYLKVALPFLIIVLSDTLIHINTGQGFHSGTPVVYLSYLAVSAVSFFTLWKISFINIFTTSLLSSFVFFLITNFAFFYPASETVNLTLGTYPHTFEGISASYMAALPFFKNALVGDLVFTAILFGVFALFNSFVKETNTQAA
jgi:hypothetical protein